MSKEENKTSFGERLVEEVHEHVKKLMSDIENLKLVVDIKERQSISEKIGLELLSHIRKHPEHMLDGITKAFGLPKTKEEWDSVYLHAQKERKDDKGKHSRVELGEVDEKLWEHVEPENNEMLLNQIKGAITKKVAIRAYTTGYAWTNVNSSRGLLISMSKLNKIETTLNCEILNARGREMYEKRHLIRAESGATYEDVNNLLWPVDKRQVLEDASTGQKYRMINNTPGFLKLSIVGTAHVGAMGMGSQYEGMTSLIRSFLLLTVKDRKIKLYQIERSVENGGIHDQTKWNKAHPDIELIQDDKVFNNTIVSMGINGVICSMYVEVVDAFFLSEERTMYTLEEFKSNYAKWRQEEREGTIDRMEFWFSPYTFPFSEKYKSSPPVVASFYRKTNKTPPKVINEKNGGQARGPYPLMFSASALAILSSKLHCVDLMATVLFVALSESCHEACSMSGIEALDFGTGNYMPTDAIGVGFNEELCVDAVVQLKDLFEKLAHNKKHFITSPYSLRFSKFSNGTISTAYQKKPCAWIELPLLNFNKTKSKVWQTLIGATEGEMDTYAAVFDLLMGKKFQGIVHYGLWFKVDKSIWENINQDDFQSFVENYKHFNSERFFCNDFTSQSGLDAIAFSTSESKKKAF